MPAGWLNNGVLYHTQNGMFGVMWPKSDGSWCCDCTDCGGCWTGCCIENPFNAFMQVDLFGLGGAPPVDNTMIPPGTPPDSWIKECGGWVGGDLPDSWELQSLDQMCSHFSGVRDNTFDATWPADRPFEFGTGDVPFFPNVAAPIWDNSSLSCTNFSGISHGRYCRCLHGNSADTAEWFMGLRVDANIVEFIDGTCKWFLQAEVVQRQGSDFPFWPGMPAPAQRTFTADAIEIDIDLTAGCPERFNLSECFPPISSGFGWTMAGDDTAFENVVFPNTVPIPWWCELEGAGICVEFDFSNA